MENYVVTLSLNAHVGLILATMLVYVPEVILDKDLLVIVPVSGFKVCVEKKIRVVVLIIFDQDFVKVPRMTQVEYYESL